jgi:hypothetical protein
MATQLVMLLQFRHSLYITNILKPRFKLDLCTDVWFMKTQIYVMC